MTKTTVSFSFKPDTTILRLSKALVTKMNSSMPKFTNVMVLVDTDNNLVLQPIRIMGSKPFNKNYVCVRKSTLKLITIPEVSRRIPTVFRSGCYLVKL